MSYFDDYVADGLCCATCGTFIGFDEPGHILYCCDACDPDKEIKPKRGKRGRR